MKSKKKAPEDEKCPNCGCPELGTYVRQRGLVVIVYTSCPNCSHILRDASAPADTPPLEDPST